MTVSGLINRVEGECIFSKDDTSIKFCCNGRIVELIGFDKTADSLVMKFK